VQRIPKTSGDENGVEGGDENGVEGGIAYGVGGGSLDTRPTLPARTPLYDAIDGAFIGETTTLFRAAPVETRGAWQRFELDTEYGKVNAWVRSSAPARG
jgi:hypothetical protein